MALATALKVSTDFLLMGKDSENAIGELPIADVSLLDDSANRRTSPAAIVTLCSSSSTRFSLAMRKTCTSRNDVAREPRTTGNR